MEKERKLENEPSHPSLSRSRSQLQLLRKNSDGKVQAVFSHDYGQQIRHHIAHSSATIVGEGYTLTKVVFQQAKQEHVQL